MTAIPRERIRKAIEDSITLAEKDGVNLARELENAILRVCCEPALQNVAEYTKKFIALMQAEMASGIHPIALCEKYQDLILGTPYLHQKFVHNLLIHSHKMGVIEGQAGYAKVKE